MQKPSSHLCAPHPLLSQSVSKLVTTISKVAQIAQTAIYSGQALRTADGWVHKYDDIFNGTLAQKKNIIDILRNNMEKHKQFSRAQDGPLDANN